MWGYNSYSELYHHGILGQKWGVRRFQNRDGTLTDQGRERYGYKEFRNEVRDIRRQAADMTINNKYRRYKNRYKALENAQRVVEKFGRVGEFVWYTSGYSFRDRIRFQLAERKLKNALEDVGDRYAVTFDEKTDEYKLRIQN